MDELKQKKNMIYIAIIGVAVLTTVVLLIWYMVAGRHSKGGLFATTEVSKEKEDNTTVTVNIDTIQDGFDDMGFLVTQEYFFTQVETYTKDKKILGVFDSSSGFTYSYDGKVTAGIDFSDVTVSENKEEKKITVEIPSSIVNSVDIDPKTFQVYSEKDSLWNPLKIEDYNVSLEEFEDTARQKAYDNGILDRSDEQAKELIKKFVEGFPGVSEYDIEIVQRRGTNES